MSKRAVVYLVGVSLVAAALGALALARPNPTPLDWWAFGALAIAGTLAQLSKSIFKSKPGLETGTVSFSPTIIFLLAGVILLPPSLFVLSAMIPHLVEWTKERYHKSSNLPVWYIQPFNISTHIICGLAAQWTYVRLLMLTSAALPGSVALSMGALVTVTGTVLAYVGLNHVLIGLALVLARGVTWKESGILNKDSLLPDLMMACLGSVMALLWRGNPWLAVLALSPLVMIERALAVPQLRQEARTDSKTGLWNARHFAELFKAELVRAKRFGRPLAIIVGDLDLLRNINNTYGHLAGDAVLEAVGQIIRSTIREYDIPARFGGEEFVIALPETTSSEAEVMMERLRTRVEAHDFVANTTPAPIHATISLGCACFPHDASTATELVHAADLAVYQAKLQGRNRSFSYSTLARSGELELKGGRGHLEFVDEGFSYSPDASLLRAPGG